TIFIALFFPAMMLAQAPCTVTNATGCVCADQQQTDCDLLPDITISDWAILNYLGGPTEYSQTGNGSNNGRLRISGSTPNMGVGAFTVGSVQQWVCNGDTFTDYNTATQFCQYPTQLIKQKIYHKNGNNMSYWERWAGGMTYHPTHGHMHVDDWATFTLRIEYPNDPDPLNWPIVGDGAKIGFCLMDYGTCTYYNGHCRDSSGNIWTNNSFPNWGLGGGNYNCSPIEQGISVGHTDIYSENLDGMWIDIPPGTCNGDYYIVIEVDPNNNFLESNEDNNWTAVPFTLTQQVPNGQFVADISAQGSTTICAGDAVTLTATSGSSYVWSNGATTQSIQATAAGQYTVTVTAPCGTDASDPMTVTVMTAPNTPTGTGATDCAGSSVNLTVSGQGSDFNWYDAPGGNLVGTGLSFTTPTLFASTDYYVEEVDITPGAQHNVGPANPNIGGGSFHQNNSRYLEFDALEDFTLVSVYVDAGSAGNRDIELRDDNGNVVASTTINIPQGGSRITLNFNVPTGTGYELGLGGNSTTDLFRNNNGVNYPYVVQNVASINTSSAGGSYYYFYYDWEIRTADLECASPLETVTATITPGPAVNINGLNANYLDTDPPVTMTGSPAGGTFSGPGVSGSTFSPATAGSGTHTITYTYTDAQGCVGTTDVNVTVDPNTGINHGLFAVVPTLYPNPNDGNFTLAFSLNETHDVSFSLKTLTGKTVMTRELGAFAGAFERAFDMSELAGGIYFLELNVDGEKVRTKMIKH
ncbi:MAG: T9SS type A sorting domain-containing protein, partial [Bacteroidota bacterium]